MHSHRVLSGVSAEKQGADTNTESGSGAVLANASATDSHVSELALLKRLLAYDPETGRFRWLVNNGTNARAGTLAGTLCPRSGGYRKIRIRDKPYSESRLAYLFMTGAWPDGCINHLNRDRADNRWANLRLATPSERRGTSAVMSGTASGLKGVTWQKHANMWRAQIETNGRKVHLGYFVHKETAHAAYMAAAWARYGDFAYSGKRRA
jgi:hypothetical protein